MHMLLLDEHHSGIRVRASGVTGFHIPTGLEGVFEETEQDQQCWWSWQISRLSCASGRGLEPEKEEEVEIAWRWSSEPWAAAMQHGSTLGGGGDKKSRRLMLPDLKQLEIKESRVKQESRSRTVMEAVWGAATAGAICGGGTYIHI